MTSVLEAGPRHARRRWTLPAFRDSLWLLAPVCLLYGVFAVVPFALIVRFAAADRGEHFLTVLRSRLLLRAAANTLAISVTTTAIAIVIAYVLAAGLWRARPGFRRVLLAFVLLPFWTAVLIKNFAWAALLQDNGVVNTLLQMSGLTSAPVTLLHNRLAVIIGMVHYVLPYAVFPIFNAMMAIDPNVERAARSLGAKTGSVIWFVVFPLTLPGIYSATVLVFVVSIGFFVTPVILGAPSDMMIANLVKYYVHELVDFNAGSALAVLILAAVVPLIMLQQSLPAKVDMALSNVDQMSPNAGLGRILLFAACLPILVLLVLPSLIIVPMALTKGDLIQFPPIWISIHSFTDYLGDPAWVDSTVLSFKVSTLAVAIGGVAGATAAIAMHGRRFPGRNLVAGLIMSPIVVPAIVLALGDYLLLAPFQLIGNWIALAVVHAMHVTPYVFISVQTSLTVGLSTALLRSARSLGAGHFSVFRFVHWPAIRPGLLAGGVLGFAVSFDDVVLSLFLQGPNTITLPVRMFTAIEYDLTPKIAASASVFIALAVLGLLVHSLGTARRTAA